MSSTNNFPITWDDEQDKNLFGNLFPSGLSTPSFQNSNSKEFRDVTTKKSYEETSSFKNSPFGQYWEKNLPNWALNYYGSSRVITTTNIKFVDKTSSISQSIADGYAKLLKGNLKPYQYKVFYHSTGDGEEVLNIYNDPKIIPSVNEVFVFIEIDDGKFDFGKIVRVKLGVNVINDLKFKFGKDTLSDDELAEEIIRKINLLKDDNIVVKDIKNSKDFNKLLVRAINFEYNNKKFDEFSFLIFLTTGLEFLEFKSLDWLKHISHWLRERKYEEEKYWNGHLDKGYEPAFLPTSLFNKTKEEKEKLIKEMVTKPLTFIDELLENQFKEKTVLSDFIRPKLQTFRNEIDQKLKPFGLQMIKAVDVAEGLETIIQYYNALWVGIWNGILEFIAGLFDLVGIIILILKQEVGFRITDALWQKIEKLFNFVYYDTQKFWDLILDKAITFVFQVYYLDLNGYKVAKEIGELIPDIVTFAISWIKAAKVAKVGSVAVATEEIVTKEALKRIEKESIEELGEKGFKEVEEHLDDVVRLIEKLNFKLQKMKSLYIGEETGMGWCKPLKVKYLDEVERLDYKLTIKEGKLYDNKGNLFDTSEAGTLFGDEKAIFVMNEKGEVFASKYQGFGQFHHSSFLEGNAISSAGELKVTKGIIEEISRKSGHYQPTTEINNQIIVHLKKNGIETKNIKLTDGF